jgi:tryptophanyl-tRNA synthetase
VQILQPIQERRASFSEAQVEEILNDGSLRASARAEETMQQVRSAMRLKS